MPAQGPIFSLPGFPVILVEVMISKSIDSGTKKRTGVPGGARAGNLITAARRGKPGRGKAGLRGKATNKKRTGRSTKGGGVGLPGTVLPFDLGQEGATARVVGRQVTIAAGVPGDQVLVRMDPRITGRAQFQALTRPSIHRVVAPCSVLDRCGGCSLQAMDYKGQLRAKSLAFRSALASLGCPPSDIGAVQGLQTPLGHRTKLVMPATSTGRALRFGFYLRGTLKPLAAEGCPVQHPLALGVLAMVQQVLDGAGVLASDVLPRDPRGWLHAVGVRVDPQSGGAELTLSGRSERLPGGKDMVTRLMGIPSVNTLALSVNPERSSYPMTPPFKVLAGKRRNPFHLAGQRFELSPGTFFQTSTAGAELLAKSVRELLPEWMECLADLYGGAGIFSCLNQDRWEKAIVVEESPVAMDDLRKHTRRENMGGITIMPGKVETRIKRVLAAGPDVVLLDPPRRGCKPAVMDALLESTPPTILYVACGWDGFLENAKLLVKGGYKPTAARAVDMFPHTTHLETVVRFDLDL